MGLINLTDVDKTGRHILGLMTKHAFITNRSCGVRDTLVFPLAFERVGILRVVRLLIKPGFVQVEMYGEKVMFAIFSGNARKNVRHGVWFLAGQVSLSLKS